MTQPQCNATAELMTADMTVLPGVTLRCELAEGHHLDRRMHPLGGLIDEADYGEALLEYNSRVTEPWRQDAWRVLPGIPHACTLTWSDPTTDELAEVLDPDESFDLEVDIADEAVLEQQQNNALANGEPVDERDYPREVDPIPEAPRRCSVCGKAIEYLSPRDSRAWGWQHADRSRGVDLSHPARP